jgi:hypothetical protein
MVLPPIIAFGDRHWAGFGCPNFKIFLLFYF